MYSEPNDEEAQFANPDQQFLFSEKSIRLGFVRKVYSILLCQLMVTCAFMTIFLYVEEVKEYSRKNIWLWIVALCNGHTTALIIFCILDMNTIEVLFTLKENIGVLTFVTLIAMACCENVRRQFPMNLIFLSIFTLCESYLLGAVASCYDAEAVLIAAGITAVVALALTIFAFQTKWDFTMMGGLLFVFLIVLIVFGILAAILHNKILEIVYASIGALIFSAYLVFDTQMMLGGKHKYALSPEEYIFAALNLYLDVINLFLFILRIVGAARN